VSENRVLRSISGPKSGNKQENRKMNNEELHNVYSSPNVIMLMKQRKIRLTWHVAFIRHDKFVQNFGRRT
jgi:hypothetical protein